MNKISKYSRPFSAVLFVIGIMVCTLASRTISPKFVGPERIYVDVDAEGTNDGTSWTNAYNHLQDALDRTITEGYYPYEIWVAEGIYYPDEESVGTEHTNNSQYESFTLDHDYIELYGGFSGSESSLSERDWEANLTILSGDIDKNDNNLDGNHVAEDWTDIAGSNAYHVITLDGVTYDDITSATVIDGFVITAGDATGLSHFGAGILCLANSATGDCHPELRDLRIQGNQSLIGGGVMLYADMGGKSNPQMTNISILGNRSLDDGGGMYVFVANDQGSESSPTLVNVRFHHNSSGDDGGGLGLITSQGNSSPTLSNVEFCSNVAAGDGGGLNFNSSSAGTLISTLTNLSFFGNQANSGGGIKTFKFTGSTFEMDIVNTVVWGNVGTHSRPEIYNYGSTPEISYSDIKDCGGSGSGWDSTFCGTDGGNNIDEDPLFKDGYECDLSLLVGSPVIDTGDQSALPLDITDMDRDGNFAETLPDDLAFNPRVEGNEVDMGVYEYYLLDHDKIGHYDPTTSFFYLKPANETGWDGVNTFKFGPPGGGREPIAGNWDGFDEDTIGQYDPVTSFFYLKPANETGWDGVNTFKWGPPGGGRIPITGDWDGNGTDTVGHYDPVLSKFYLKPANETGWDGVNCFKWGPAGGGRIPIVGDWNGNGTDTIGLYDPVTSIFYLKPANETGWDGVISFKFGPAGGGRVPIAGDWDGDGTDTIGQYDPVTSFFYLKPANETGWDGVNIFKFGPPGGGREAIAGMW